jgi:hypothetical protein
MKTNRGQKLVPVWLGLCVLCMTGSALATDYTNDTDWAGGNWTLANGDVISGIHTNVGVFTIPSGATVTVLAYDTNSLLHGRVTVYAASADIQGTLSADAKGYPRGVGAGAPPSGSTCGGSYGGLGGMGNTGSPAPQPYGSPYVPTDLGSGAGNYATGAGSGGGTVILNVSGTLIVAGTISANGGNGSNSNSGGGSGGSVWLTAGTLQGSGSILADGGLRVTGSATAGGGGGGRIALDANDNTFSGTIRARGQASSHVRGRHGTLNFSSNPAKHLVISEDIALPPGTNWVFASLLVTNNATLEIQSTHGTLVASYANEEASRVRILGDATVAAGATLSAEGLGYPETFGLGKGLTYGGGGYGGKGGNGSGTGGSIYGTNNAPDRLGSGAGDQDIGGFGGGALILNVGGTMTVLGTVSCNGGKGAKKGGGGSGGSVWLKVQAIAGNGAISANGGNFDASNGGGGGGGRIMIDFGKGAMVKYTWTDPVTLPGSLGFTGTITATGGTGLTNGDPGTVLLRNLPPPEGTLIQFH